MIDGLDTFKDKEGYYVFHAGTKQTDKGIVTNGGRVLGVTAKGKTLVEHVRTHIKQQNGFGLRTNICDMILVRPSMNSN